MFPFVVVWFATLAAAYEPISTTETYAFKS